MVVGRFRYCRALTNVCASFRDFCDEYGAVWRHVLAGLRGDCCGRNEGK